MLSCECSSADLDQAPRPIDWIWHGLLAPGKVTLLTSQWKTGKTTLLSLLLAHRDRGEPLAGLAVAPGMTAMVSEEPRDLWALRKQEHGFGSAPRFFFQPFLGPPTPDEQKVVIDRLVEIKKNEPLDLVMIDSLQSFLPKGVENLSGALL